MRALLFVASQVAALPSLSGATGLATSLDAPDYFAVPRKTDEGILTSCLHNLTQPGFRLPGSNLPFSSESLVAQGAGWLEGGFVSLAFLNSGTATLRLRLNSTGLPNLAVTVRVLGLPAHVAPQQFGMRLSGSSGQPQKLTINITTWPDGEYTAIIEPDVDSTSKGGWCGGIVRWLRKQTHPDAPIPPHHVALPAALDIPLLFVDDFWVWSRNGSQRRLIPAQLLKVSNESFPARFAPGTTERLGAGGWMMPIENPLGTGTVPITVGADNSSFSFEVAVNHKIQSPASDPNASRYTCTASIEHSSTGSDVAWSCVEHNYNTSGRHQLALITQEPQRVSLPPFYKMKRVRWYNATTDGAVDIHEMRVWFNDLIVQVRRTRRSDNLSAWNGVIILTSTRPFLWCIAQEHDTVVQNITLKLAAAYAYWTRDVPGLAGTQETLLLPVNGARVPLLHGWEWGDKRTGSDARYNKTLQRGPCHSLLFGRPAGPQRLDTACIGDNYGGSWWRPARTDAAGNAQPAQFVYAIGRLVPVFAPHAAPFDNTPTVSRQMSTWATADGLTWKQEWWGQRALLQDTEAPGSSSSELNGSPQNYVRRSHWSCPLQFV